jgi:FAD dependent oxidoreductase
MTYSNLARKEAFQSISEAKHFPFWLDDPNRPLPEAELTKNISTDLLIIGAGFTGLWTALLAKEEDPLREVVIVEAGEVASGASGRNGGFMDASLTHGLQNGLARWPKEFPILLAMGIANLDQIESTIERLGIECDYMRTVMSA